MKVKDVDITEALRDALPVDSFLFNPSIAQVTGNTYLVTVRSYVHDVRKPLDTNPKLVQNPQHPWGTDWAGTDVTYILPMVITEDTIQPITSGQWPIVVPVQDTRIFRFMKDGRHAVFILTFNERYEGFQDMIIKGGDSCDDFCYLIGWSYLLVDINSLDYSYIPGQKPLCVNISNPVEKNWSLWRYDHDNKVYLMVSYSFTPVHTAFSLLIDGIEDGELVGGSTCRMVTVRPGTENNILGDLEEYYDKKLFVSLSTPSYATETGKYQAVGHIKIKLDYVKQLANSSKKSKLAKFAKKYIKGGHKKHFNPNYIYLMFVYRFQIVDAKKNKIKIDQSSGEIELTGSKNRMHALITHVTPAFVIKVEDYDYFLNFPSGMVLNEQDTIISYGYGDASSHLLYIPNEQLQKFLVPITDLTAEKFKFIHAVKDRDGMIDLA
jgi:hypothetical protein